MGVLFEHLRPLDSDVAETTAEPAAEDFDLTTLRLLRSTSDQMYEAIADVDSTFREDFENEQNFREALRFRQRELQGLQRRRRELIDRVSNGAYNYGFRDGVSVPDADMKERQRTAEAVSDSALILISREDRETVTHKEAWDAHHFEKVVELASQEIEQHTSAPSRGDREGVQQLCIHLHRRSQAYHAMQLLSLALTDLNRAYQLAAEFGVHSVAHAELSLRSRAGAPMTQYGKRPAGDTDGGSITKKPKQDSSRQVARPIGILSLSTELLLIVSDFVEPADRIRLANSCRELRRIPQLWQQLVFKRIRQTLRVGWHHDTIGACVAAIATCQRRSHGTLTSVILKGYILPNDLEPIFEVLRTNSHSLRYLAIPTLDQERCYRGLYQQCPNLVGIDIRINHRHSSDSALFGLVEKHNLGPTTSLFPISSMPFRLRYFLASTETDCGDLSQHMAGLEVVEGVCRDRQKRPSFIKGLVSIAPTLREWTDCLEARWDPLRLKAATFLTIFCLPRPSCFRDCASSVPCGASTSLIANFQC